MTEDLKFPIEFKKCPNCDSTERVAELAVQEIEREKGIKREGPFASLEKTIVPLVDPRKTTKLTVPMLIIHYDLCARCGLRYCTKVELIDAPIRYSMPQQQPPGLNMRGGGARPV